MKRLTGRRLAAGLAALAVALAVAVAVGLAAGPTGPGASSDIVLGIRLPRVILAALVGASLATAGTAFQALLRNPLADPFILGVSGGAAVGAVAVLVSGVGAVGLAASITTPIAAFAGGAAATFLVYALARGRAAGEGERLLLTGVVVNAFLSALILLLNHLAPPSRRVAILGWLMGDLQRLPAGLEGLVPLAVAAALGLATFVALARDLDLISLGERAAAPLGVDVGRTRTAAFFAGSLLAGAAVAYSGLVGFVGLIVPHILRRVLGPDHRLLIPAAFLGGAAFLVVADALARSLLGPEELPVGIVTALCGGPFFLVLLLGGRRHAS